MQRLLGWVSSIIGVLAATMMFAANISFDQARSNLSSWLPQTLLNRFPPLQSVAADQATSLIGIALAILAFGLFMWRRSALLQRHMLGQPVSVKPVVQAPLRTAQRVFVPNNITVEFLFELRANKTTIQSEPLIAPYLGKWMCLTGPLRNVHEPSGRWDVELNASRPTMMVVLAGKSNEDIYLYFDSSWLDRLHMLPLGQIIKVQGRIAKIYQYEIQLENCELVNYESSTNENMEIASVPAPKQ